MPYIKQERRKAVEEGDIQNVGELNYYITMKLLGYMKEHGESYKEYVNVFAVLECARMCLITKLRMKIDEHPPEGFIHSVVGPLQDWYNPYEALATISMVEQEMYRRRIGKYEDGAISRNGDLEGFQ